MDNRVLAKEWFDIAALDLSSAIYLQNMHPVPVEIICYHYQQSSEKYLKGFLALKGHDIVKTHDLLLLNKLCCQYDAEFVTIEEQCLRLTDYGVNIRYPYPMDLNTDDLKLALKDAKKIQAFILKKSHHSYRK